MKNNIPLIFGALVAGGIAYSQSSKPSKKKDDGKCGCFTAQFILNKNCTIIEKVNPLYDPVKDFEKIDKYIDSLDKEIDIYQITDTLLTKKYGYCLKHDFELSVYQYLYINQLFDIARVLYLFDNITCEQYKELVFVEFLKDYNNINKKGLIDPYLDGQGIIIDSDNILDEQIIDSFIKEIKPFKSIDWLSKDSSCLAISILLNQYIQNEFDIMIYSWSLTNQETLKRFERFTNIVNQAKLKVKQNG